MGENSKIEWTDHTFNPWVGCTKLTPACDNCYAEGWAKRTGHPELWQKERRRTSPGNWKLPLKWEREAAAAGRRARVFCASLADVFDNQVPPAWRTDLFALIRSTPNLDWQLLTKRPENIAKMLPADWGDGYPNVWLGTTAEDQTRANHRVPLLLRVQAKVRFLSCEPLLGPVDLRRIGMVDEGEQDCLDALTGEQFSVRTGCEVAQHPGLDWIIAGGESGPRARPSHPDWFRSLRDQCAAAGVPFLFKQWGEWWEVDSDARDDAGNHLQVGEQMLAEGFDKKEDCLISPNGEVFRDWNGTPADVPCRWMTRLGKKAAGRLLDGGEHNGFPGCSS